VPRDDLFRLISRRDIDITLRSRNLIFQIPLRRRRTERVETDHVMSFMQYGGRLEDRGLRNGLGIATIPSPFLRPRSSSLPPYCIKLIT
jgi:hypothetical protein